jgi:hypothetical protein
MDEGAPQGLVDLLAEFSYKPRWRFELEPAGTGLRGVFWWSLFVHTWVEDVFQPGVWAEGVHMVPVPQAGDAGAEFWEHWLHDQVWGVVERHEVDEWFRVGDRRPFDPHAAP